MNGPWFEEQDVHERIQTGTQRTRWNVRDRPAPNGNDVREIALAIWRSKETRPILWLVVAWSVFDSVLNAGLNSVDLPGSIEYIMRIMGFALVLSLAGSVRETLLNPLATAPIVRLCLKRLPSVFFVTLTSVVALFMGMMMCVLPAFIVLPLVVRAPYEAATGANPIRAFLNAASSATKSRASTISATLAVLYFGLGFFVIDMVRSELIVSLSVPEYAAVMVYEILVAGLVLFTWVHCTAAFLLGDAVMFGVFTPAHSAEHRRERESGFRRIWFAPTTRTVVAIVVFISAIGITTAGNQPGLWQGFFGRLAERLSPEVEPFSFEMTDGTTFHSDQLRGKPTLIVVWAPWCSTCEYQTGELRKLMPMLDDTVNVVSIVVQYKDEDEVTRYMVDHGINYPVLLGDDSLWPNEPVTSFPTIVILNDHQNILSREAGGFDAEYLRSVLTNQ